MLTQYKNEYMLINDQKSIMTGGDDTISMTSTLIPTASTSTGNEKSNNNTTTTTTLPKRSNSVNQLCRRISTSIKRSLSEGRQSRRESRREKRPQDGKTNPME